MNIYMYGSIGSKCVCVYVCINEWYIFWDSTVSFHTTFSMMSYRCSSAIFTVVYILCNYNWHKLVVVTTFFFHEKFIYYGTLLKRKQFVMNFFFLTIFFISVAKWISRWKWDLYVRNFFVVDFIYSWRNSFCICRLIWHTRNLPHTQPRSTPQFHTTPHYTPKNILLLHTIPFFWWFDFKPEVPKRKCWERRRKIKLCIYIYCLPLSTTTSLPLPLPMSYKREEKHI